MCFHSGNAKTGCQRRAMRPSGAATWAFAVARCASTSSVRILQALESVAAPCHVRTGMACDLQAVPPHQAGLANGPQPTLQHALYRTAHRSGQAGVLRGSCGQPRPAGPVAAGRTNEKAYEIDAGNRVIAYHLADLLFELQRGERARFPFCRLNNGGYANAKSLREGSRVERALDATSAARQRVRPLPRRSADSTEWQRYEQGAFHG